ncbi:MAG TPA: PAS domain S-box protein, partial [Thermoanaerobaculia bacterium]
MSSRKGAVPRGIALLALAGLVAVAALLVSLNFYLDHERAAAVNRWKGRLESLADDRRIAIETWLGERLFDGRLVAQDRPTGALLPGVPGESKETAARHLAQNLALLVVGGPYSGASIRNGEGRALVRAGIDETIDEAVARMSVSLVARHERERIEFTRKTSGAPALVFLVPVLGPSGTAVGAVALSVDPDRWLYPFVQRETTPTRTAECVLVRRVGEWIVNLNRLRSSPAEPMALTAPDRAGLSGHVAIDGKPTFGEYFDYRGVPVFAATRPIAGTDWGFVAKIDRSEAFAMYRERRREAVLFVGALLAALFGLTFGVWRNEHLHRLADAARRDERFRMVMEEANDGLMFVRPADGRILEVNRTATRMYGYSVDELKALSAGDLRVPEERAALPAQMARALESGIVVETRHMRKDGSVFHADVSVRGVDLGGERVLFATMRDITERKAAETSVHFLNRLLKALSEINELIVREKDRDWLLAETCRIAVEEGGFRMAWIGLLDPSGSEIVPFSSAGVVEGYLDSVRIRIDDSPLGRSPKGGSLREGQTFVVNDSEADGRPLPFRDRALERGYRSSAGAPIRIGAKVVGALSVYGSDKGIFTGEVVGLLEGLADDIGFALSGMEAEERRRRMEDELRSSEERFRGMVNALPFPIVLTRISDGAALFTNPAGLIASGLTEGKVAGERARDFYVHPADHSTVLEELRRTGVVREREVRLKRKGGEQFWALISCVTTTYGGEPAVLSTIIDNTAQKTMLARVILLNRLLRTISEINELIVREMDPSRLLSEACRITVERGEFRMAWI